MKFLEHSGLADLEMKLSGLEVGDFVLDSKFEAYSCRLPQFLEQASSHWEEMIRKSENTFSRRRQACNG